MWPRDDSNKEKKSMKIRQFWIERLNTILGVNLQNKGGKEVTDGKLMEVMTTPLEENGQYIKKHKGQVWMER